jgi:hypothetical protein
MIVEMISVGDDERRWVRDAYMIVCIRTAEV